MKQAIDTAFEDLTPDDTVAVLHDRELAVVELEIFHHGHSLDRKAHACIFAIILILIFFEL